MKEPGGWRLLGHPLFVKQLESMKQRVAALAASDPQQYSSHPAAKLLATVRRYIQEIIPRDPASAEFRLGNTLGADNRQWFRAKFHQRYRLFFRFSSKHKVIIYAWINNESSLRKAGSKTDPCTRFKVMLETGDPPDSFEELLKKSSPL